MTAARTPFDNLPLPQQAGMLCNETQFRQFSGTRAIKSGVTLSTTAAAEFLRTYCGITSRRDLETNPIAADKFAVLRTEYDAWRGRIARPPTR